MYLHTNGVTDKFKEKSVLRESQYDCKTYFIWFNRPI